MKLVRRIASIVATVLVAIAVVLLLLAVIGNHNASNNQSRLSQGLADTQSQLAQTQTSLAKIVKDSAETRITTVTQRCDFTRLVTNVLVQQDPKVAAPFKASLTGCLKQLAIVKKIAASAPSK